MNNLIGEGEKSSKPNLQIADGNRQQKRISREVADSVVSRLRIHRKGVRSVAQSVGLTIRETVDVLIERTEEEKAVAFQQGYRAGLARYLPPGKRRAA